ncbi:hypothetical protein B0T10DRAFT_511243 [Thelonectria olida]|uniref:Zn(2)-C6 fungal-type domain-containing protein n=1 Tax=Thelonectria olida TaxID=1576542 RepID=A0A9P9ARB6_9HYPO|nr:hypothetical protein B0T10DRAFT_511243 [Thelonectria olida]
MVNRGQPSRDCLPCRKRKLRCDLRPDGCGQCLRARLRCYGYRDPQDLVFRDETRSTKQKVVARQSHPTTMELGWNIRARYAFFSVYVLGFSHSLGPVAPFYNRASSLDHLSASIEATSLAFVAIQLHAPALKHLASISYVTAIQRLGKALSELSNSGEEEALQSILLLDMYEKMVNPNPRGSSWMSHALGGMSLLAPRLQRFASSITGRQLCGRLVTALTVSCGASALRVPDALTTLRGHLDPSMGTVKWKFTGILSQVVDLQAEFHNTGGICTTNLAERAQHLDDQLRGLEETLPLSWRSRQISPVRPDPLVFGSHYEIYADHFVTQVTNGIRVARLMVNKILLVGTSADVSNSSPSNNILAQICDITHHICATVPQFVLPEALPENSLPFSPHQSLQCCLLLAPLYIAHQVSTDSLMRHWILQCLRYMAETGCMRIAKDVADLMIRNPDVDYWLVYAMVGCYAFAA